MMRNKQAVELSINMLVVIILGIVILGAGFTIFYKTYNKVGGLNDQVDAQTQQRLNALLDDGSPIVILMNNREANRGDSVDFGVAINNNLQSTKQFTVIVTYAGTTANYGEDVTPFQPVKSVADINNGCNGQPEECGNSWILGGKRQFTLKNNEREYFPVRITIPKKNILRGQYIFNVDVCKDSIDEPNPGCHTTEHGLQEGNRFSGRKKIYVTIN